MTRTSDLAYRAWDVASGEPIAFPFPNPYAHDGMLVSNADMALFGSRLFDLRNNHLLAEVTPGPGWIAFATFSPSGEELLVGGRDREAHVWAARTGKRIGPALLHDQTVSEGAFSPDGSRVSTRSATARIWETASGRPLTPPPPARLAPRSAPVAVIF